MDAAKADAREGTLAQPAAAAVPRPAEPTVIKVRKLDRLETTNFPICGTGE